MYFRFTVLAVVASLMVLGCANNPSVSTNETRLWRAQKERQQRIAREAGRIGHIGNLGPALGVSAIP
jgi:outer membrane biogenesis lipoprotein LolB